MVKLTLICKYKCWNRPSMDREESLSALREKCVFCGGKMDVLLEALQSQLRGGEQTSLAPATEDTVLLAIAGLKQVHTHSLTHSLTHDTKT